MVRSPILLLFSASILLQAQGAVRLKGRVLGNDGSPMPGVTLAVMPLEDGSYFPSKAVLTHSTTDGTFGVEVKREKVSLTATVPGCLPYQRTLDLGSLDGDQTLDIRLRPGGCRVEGTIQPAPRHHLARTRLVFRGTQRPWEDWFYANVEGSRYTINLPPGTFVLVAEDDGQISIEPATIPGDQTQSIPVALTSTPVPAPADVRTWIKAHAHPLRASGTSGDQDLGPLGSMVGRAQVIGFGEATHGTHEFFTERARYFKYLVKTANVDTLALEVGVTEARAVEDFLQTGSGDPVHALRRLVYWIWQTREMLDLVRWMRAYNLEPSHRHKLHFIGLDMQMPEWPLVEARARLAQTSPSEVPVLDELGRRWSGLPWIEQRKELSGKDRQAWMDVASDLKKLDGRIALSHGTALPRSPGRESRSRLHEDLQSLVQWATYQKDGLGVRETSMCANLLSALKGNPGNRIFLWAHNGHVAFQQQSAFSPLGWHLRQALGPGYVSFGLCFREGSFQANWPGCSYDVRPHPSGTLDEALASAGHPALLLDLHALPPAGRVRDWFEDNQGTWEIGSYFNENGKDGALSFDESPQKRYDGLVFLARTQAVRPLENSVGWGEHPSLPPAPSPSSSPRNLGFEDGEDGKAPADWILDTGKHFQAAITSQGALEGRRCLHANHLGAPVPGAWCLAYQTFEAIAYRGRRLRITGQVRTSGSEGFESELMGSSLDGKGLRRDYRDRPITSRDWTTAVLDVPVPPDATTLTLTWRNRGSGEAWLDGVKVEVLP
jgi:erythromycin esterase